MPSALETKRFTPSKSHGKGERVFFLLDRDRSFNSGNRPLISRFSRPYIRTYVYRNRAWHDKRVIREKGWSRFSSHTYTVGIRRDLSPRRIWICQSEVSSQRVAARERMYNKGAFGIMPSRMLKDFFFRCRKDFTRIHEPAFQSTNAANSTNTYRGEKRTDLAQEKRTRDKSEALVSPFF